MAQEAWAVAVMDALHGYRERGFLCDLSLESSDGSRLRVHRCILAAAAPSLYSELAASARRKKTKKLKCSMHGLQALVHFLYTGVLDSRACEKDEEGYLASLLHISTEGEETEGEKTDEIEMETEPSSMEQGQPSVEVAVSCDADTLEDTGEILCTDATGTIHCEVLDADQVPKELVSSTLTPDTPDQSKDDDILDGPAADSLELSCEGPEANEELGDINTLAAPKLFLCNKCEKSFPTQEKLSTHERACRVGMKRKSRRRKKVYKAKRYVCPQCNAVLGTTQTLKQHIAFIHNKEKNFPCEVCGRAFARKGHYLDHKTTQHTEEKPYKCDLCPKSFKLPQYLKSHQNSCRDDGIKEPSRLKYKCPQCPRRFMTVEGQRKHCETCEPSPKKWFHCEICNKALASKTSLNDHVKCMHQGIKNYVCNICNSAYGNKSSWYEHRLSHRNVNTIICKHCGKKFQGAGARRKHERICLKTGEPHVCSKCDASFKTRREWVEHEKEIHAEDQFKCETCGQVLLTNQSLIHHLKYVHKEKDIICPTCGKAFRSKGNLKEHQERVHENKKEHLCRFCGQDFFSNCEVRIHELTHTKIKEFTCSTCGKQFTTKSALSLHNVWHRKERRFQCSYCAKKFVMKQCLQIHERYHTGERPYKCNFCQKAFASTSVLRSHERSHTGERPYHCTVCSATYVHSGKLKEHHKKKHGLDLPSCQYKPTEDIKEEYDALKIEFNTVAGAEPDNNYFSVSESQDVQ